jgi:quaternary ammonium compound-resistance protein SugE
LGVAYAVWTGIGAAGTAIVGFAYFKDPFNTLTLLFLVLLVGSIVGLKMVAPA